MLVVFFVFLPSFSFPLLLLLLLLLLVLLVLLLFPMGFFVSFSRSASFPIVRSKPSETMTSVKTVDSFRRRRRCRRRRRRLGGGGGGLLVFLLCPALVSCRFRDESLSIGYSRVKRVWGRDGPRQGHTQDTNSSNSNNKKFTSNERERERERERETKT